MSADLPTTFAAILSLTALAPAAAAKEGRRPAAVLVPAGKIQWTSVPDSPGVQVAVLQGDPGKGPIHFLIKLQDGFASPLHHHSPDHYVTVLSGTLILTVDGRDTTLPAGSYFSFTGRMVHATRCAPGADCVLSVDARGPWDVVPGKPATTVQQ